MPFSITADIAAAIAADISLPPLFSPIIDASPPFRLFH